MWLRENIGPLLALITVVGTFTLFGLAFFLEVSGTQEKVLFMVIGALSSIATTVVGYYFGSSEGSAKKTIMLGSRLGWWRRRESNPPSANIS